MKNIAILKLILLTVCLAMLRKLDAQVVTKIYVNHGVAKSLKPADLTFGMIFKAGDIPKGRSLSSSFGTMQIDAKATHPDGSLRHAVLSLHFDSLDAGPRTAIQLSLADPAGPRKPIEVMDVLKTAFDAQVVVTIAGMDYKASVRDVLASPSAKLWLSGPQCTEWLVNAPFKNSAGKTHPLLQARFAIRAYQGLKHIRADITVENDWAFEPNPAGIIYDAKVTVGTESVWVKAGLEHTHHTRWRRVLWYGDDPSLDYAYDRDYLFSTGAFPYFDRGLEIAPQALAGLKTDFEPMSIGGFTSYMPQTGAHPDIGPLPNFAALYLLTLDTRARLNVLANGNCGGSYQIHYRHKASDLPVTIDQFPYMTLLGNRDDTRNPKTGKLELFPEVTNGLTKHNPDDAHQPSIAYLPYIISGDYFYLEELQFWANYNMVISNPVYRSLEKGLLRWGQVRAQAWSMRTLGQAAYITPDNHPLKKYFTEKINNNIEWYTEAHVGNPKANDLGYLEGHYDYEPYGIAPWMDDFFTWSMGFLDQLGFVKVKPLLLFKSKFVVGRLTDPGVCWLNASEYSLQVGTAQKIPYRTFAQVHQANYPKVPPCVGFKMIGYPDEATGFGANMQPALAVAVDAGARGALEAWNQYQERMPKQDYTSMPEFSVVPKTFRSGPKKTLSNESKSASKAGESLLPGSILNYTLAFPSDVFLEVFDTIGTITFSKPLGQMKKGNHSLDWEKTLQPGLPKGKNPRIVKLKAVDQFKHAEYVKVFRWE
jgi:hypothetical protein